MPSLLYLRAGFDPSLIVSGDIAVGDIAFDLAHTGGESLLYLTSPADETVEKAKALGATLGKVLLLRPSGLPAREVKAAGGAREWLRGRQSAARRQNWQRVVRRYAEDLDVSTGAFLSKDAVQVLQAESEVVGKRKLGETTFYRLREPDDAGRTFIAPDPERLAAAVTKALHENMPAAATVPVAEEAEDRFLEVDAERQVTMESTIRVNVRIAATPPAAQPFELLKLLIPSSGIAVTVVVDGGAGLNPLDAPAGMLTVMRGTDTPWLLFRFKPLRGGPHPISVRLFTGGTLTATLMFEVFVDHEAPRETPIRKNVKLRNRGADEVSLDIRFEEGVSRYRYRWIDGFQPRAPERESKRLTSAPSELITSVVNDLNRIARGAVSYEPGVLRKYLQTRGIQLWDELIPEDLQHDFWDRKGDAKKLTIHTDADPMLWEVLYPYGGGDDGFLIEQMLVSRWCAGLVPSPELPSAKSLIVVPGKGSPKNARQEADAVGDLLSRRGSVTTVETLRELLDALDDQPDVVHFACHNTFTPAGSQIAFPDGNFDAPFLRTKRLPAGVVFVNACRSDGVATTYTGLTSWAAEFVRSGAGAFVGSLWEVTDNAATEFAKTFYERLLDRDVISVAMQRAREAIRHHNDPTWLAYTLYADPTAVLS